MELLTQLRRSQFIALALALVALVFLPSPLRPCPLADQASAAMGGECATACCTHRSPDSAANHRSSAPLPVDGLICSAVLNWNAANTTPAVRIAPLLGKDLADAEPEFARANTFLSLSSADDDFSRSILPADTAPPSAFLKVTLRRCQPGNAPPFVRAVA